MSQGDIQIVERKLAYTVEGFCAAVGIGRTTFYELVKAGELHPVRVRGRRLIQASEAERFVESLSAA